LSQFLNLSLNLSLLFGGIITNMLVYINGKIVPSEEAVVSVFDHGFLYGDGIYETMNSYDGVIFKLDEHLERLYRSASLINLTIPLEAERLKSALYEILLANVLKNAYVRLSVSRGQGPIGLNPDLCLQPTIVIMAQASRESPVMLYEKGVHLIISETRRNLKEAIDPRIKSMNFLNNILAKIEAINRDAYEAIMLNARNHLTEGTISNLFFTKDNILCTPSVSCGILDGITRGTVIDLAVREDIKIKEGEFSGEDLYSATEVFITNTSLEVMPVSKVDKTTYPVGNITKRLHKAYKQEVQTYLARANAEGQSS
jgi:branched-chain amino acid aminotransferase